MKNETLDNYIRYINSDKTQDFISDLLRDHPRDSNLSNDEISELTNIIAASNYVYNNSGIETMLSDDTYNTLIEKLELAQDTAADTSARIPSGKGKTAYHRYKSLRGTLDKVYYISEEDAATTANASRRGLPQWIASSEKKLEETLGYPVSLADEEIYVFPKWDGVSCVFEFNADGSLNKALTRGFTETNEAQDITHIFEGWVTGPWSGETPYGIKTEIMMSEDDLLTYNEIYGTNYKNSRSIVSSIINSDERDNRVKYLQIISLRASFINEDGTESQQTLTPGAFDKPYIRCRLKDVKLIKEFAFTHKYVDGLRCDGAVIYLINEEYQSILGRKDNKQKFEVAFKFTEEIGYSSVVDVNFTVGLFGRITPVVKIAPIILKGNTIQEASLGSIKRFRALNLAKGDKVKVLYDIIPYVLMDENDPKCKRSGKHPIKEPINCPICGEPLKKDEKSAILSCDNSKCACRQKGKILNYLRKMHVDHISYGIIDQLFDEGYLKSIKDIYKLKKKKKRLIKLDGFGEASVDLILDEIDRNRTATEAQFLGSIGIESIGPKVFEQVLAHISFDELMELCINDAKDKAINTFISIPGIKEKKAEKIYFGIRENQKLIEFLEDELIIARKKKSKFVVCFTKVRSEELEKWLISQGAEISDTLSKKVDFLVVPMLGVASSKVDKAKKYNIPIIRIDDVEAYVQKTF